MNVTINSIQSKSRPKAPYFANYLNGHIVFVTKVNLITSEGWLVSGNFVHAPWSYFGTEWSNYELKPFVGEIVINCP